MVENYTKDIEESVYQGAIDSALSSCWLHNAWKNFNKNEPSIPQ